MKMLRVRHIVAYSFIVMSQNMAQFHPPEGFLLRAISAVMSMLSFIASLSFVNHVLISSSERQDILYIALFFCVEEVFKMNEYWRSVLSALIDSFVPHNGNISLGRGSWRFEAWNNQSDIIATRLKGHLLVTKKPRSQARVNQELTYSLLKR